MKEKLKFWNQYGYEMDVFDKYREPVRRSNQSSLKVLSVLVMASAIAILIYGFVTKQPMEGAFFCLAALFCGALGAFVSFRPKCRRGFLLAAGYLIGAAAYALAVYGTVAFKTDAFWIGAQLAVACYLFDYAWRVGLLQILSYLAMSTVWLVTDADTDPARILFRTLYLVISLVTFYSLNRARISLIMGREESQRQTDTDLLTGLTMRTAAQNMIEEHLKTDEHGVMMLLDLDRFKSVNDKLGHQMGDKVLVEVAADLKNMFRNSDVLSRLGGDEFVVYMKSVPERDWALQRASQVVQEVRRWIGNGTTNIQITASVGIVMTDMVNRTYDDLYRAADIAMYRAKGQGGNKALFYTRDMLEGDDTVQEAMPADTGAKTVADLNGTGEDLR